MKRLHQIIAIEYRSFMAIEKASKCQTNFPIAKGQHVFRFWIIPLFVPSNILVHCYTVIALTVNFENAWYQPNVSELENRFWRYSILMQIITHLKLRMERYERAIFSKRWLRMLFYLNFLSIWLFFWSHVCLLAIQSI